uniref:DUF4371 domain-containing protein n=1 Tax=Sinocyclocheilus rhinocerous TaxID=307959 RepID=A0A673GQG2_9TELE
MSIMLGNNAVKQLNLISLSNNTVKHRINDMAENVFQQLICRVRASRFYAIQIDESTDIAGLANLLAFENFLFCRPLHSNATAEAIFDILNDFIISSDINWTKCVELSTDGARAMLVRHSGVVKRVKDVASLLTYIHCCIHREELAAKRMPMDLKTVLDDAVRMVNYIKSRPLQARLFSLLCEEMGSEHRQLLLHTEVRWLSRGRVLTRLFQLRDEVRTFFIDSKFELADRLCDFDWLCKLAYLADIFSHLNGLNLALQGTAVTMFHVHNKIEATVKKIDLWGKRIARANYESFENVSDFLSKEERPLPVTHMQALKSQMQDYFPDISKQQSWIQYPFANHTEDVIAGLTYKEQDILVNLSCDSSLKLIFSEKTLTQFWLHVSNEYPELANKAIMFLMPFATKYICEVGFSVLVALKTKYRNVLSVESDLRLKLTSIQPDIKSLTAEKQHHPSHQVLSG